MGVNEDFLLASSCIQPFTCASQVNNQHPASQNSPFSPHILQQKAHDNVAHMMMQTLHCQPIIWDRRTMRNLQVYGRLFDFLNHTELWAATGLFLNNMKFKKKKKEKGASSRAILLRDSIQTHSLRNIFWYIGPLWSMMQINEQGCSVW